MFSWFTGFFILVIPYYARVTTPLDTRLAKDLFFAWMIFISLIFFGMKTEKVPTFLVIIFGIISFLSFFNQYDQYSFRVILQWLFVNAGMILLLQATSLLDKKGIILILNFICATALIQSTWMILNYYGVDPNKVVMSYLFPKIKFLDDGLLKEISATADARIAGSLSNSNLTGWFLSMCAPAFLRRKWNWGIIPLVIATLICQASSSIIALGSILAIYLFSIKFPIRKVFLIFSGVFLVFGSLLLIVRPKKIMNDNERYLIWKTTVNWVEKDLLLKKEEPALVLDSVFQRLLDKGVGLGIFGDYFAHMNAGRVKQRFQQLHNEFLEAWVAFGGIGILLIFVIGIRVWTLLDESKTIPFLGILATAINSIVGFPIHISSCALIFIIFSAMMFHKEGDDSWRFHQKKWRKGKSQASEFKFGHLMPPV